MGQQIQSDPAQAGSAATALSTGTSAVLGFSAAAKDGDSTITGNVNNASPLIDNMSNYANQIAAEVESVSSSITKIDENFQANDTQVAQNISELTGWDSSVAQTNRSNANHANSQASSVQADPDAYN